MSGPAITPDDCFVALVDALCGEPDVTGPSDGKGFGSSGLKVHNKIFAMLVRGKLVVKLPKSRVDALVASRDGECFDPRGDGRPMKEWVAVEPTSDEDWLPLAREALRFVASQH